MPSETLQPSTDDARPPTWWCCIDVPQQQQQFLKYFSLAILVLQNSSLILTTRFSRIQVGPQYLPSTAVFFAEVLKTLAATAVHVHNQLRRPVTAKSFGLRSLYLDCFGPNAEFHKLLIPSVIYTIQNNLQYQAITYLDAATYQVTCQLKILTTAVFSVLFLQRQLSARKWFALVVLMSGVALVQWPTSDTEASTSRASSEQQAAAASAQLWGFLCVVTACVLSGMAGVYTEKVLKTGNTSLWLRNIQMSISGVVLSGVFGVWLSDGDKVRANGGIWYGYGTNPAAVAAVLLNAFGGLLTAVVVKYADNILKGFATSIAIVLSCIVSVWLLDFHIHTPFVLGTVAVLVATYVYGMPDNQQVLLPSTTSDSLFPASRDLEEKERLERRRLSNGDVSSPLMTGSSIRIDPSRKFSP